MPDLQEKVDGFLDLLDKTREERLELLPETETFVDVIADAMNALQVAYVMVMTSSSKETPQGATFVPVSNPKEARQL